MTTVVRRPCSFFMKGEREPGRTRAYRRPRYMFIVPSVATSARLTCRNQYGTRTRIHDSLVGEFDGVLFNCLQKVPDNFLHTVSMQSFSFPLFFHLKLCSTLILSILLWSVDHFFSVDLCHRWVCFFYFTNSTTQQSS